MASSDSVPSLNVFGFSAPPNHHSSYSFPSHNNILITVTVLAVAAILSLALYFFIRYRSHCLRRLFPTSASVFSSANRISPEITLSTSSSSAVDSLPLFEFSSITRRSSSAATGDCAVCLSKFEQRDLLRLLPLCCHAFHAECIDTWLRSNLTCPLCRSTVFASESDIVKVLQPSSAAGGNSFRLEIGNISSSRVGAAPDAAAAANEETRRRSYSVGSLLEYLVDEEAEIPFSLAQRSIVSGEKVDTPPVESPAISQESLAFEVGRGSSSWLKDYVDSLSATMSFRIGSGRFFSGSSRRNDGDYEMDLEANRFGEDISEMFQWLSNV